MLCVSDLIFREKKLSIATLPQQCLLKFNKHQCNDVYFV